MGMPAIRRRWTPEDVRQLNVDTPSWPRYELIGGELLVTPSPGSPHQLAAGELYLALAPFVEAAEIGLTFFAPSDVVLREGTITQPDLYVIAAGPAAYEKRLVSPDAPTLLLVVEVISPSSVRIDRVVKRDFYMESGVAEYWVVDLDGRMIERWTPDRDTPVVERATLVWKPLGAAQAFHVELPVLFDRIWKKAAWIKKLGTDRAGR